MRYRTQCECCKAVALTAAATVAVIRPKTGVRLSKLPLTTTRQIPKNECVCAQKGQERCVYTFLSLPLPLSPFLCLSLQFSPALCELISSIFWVNTSLGDWKILLSCLIVSAPAWHWILLLFMSLCVCIGVRVCICLCHSTSSHCLYRVSEGRSLDLHRSTSVPPFSARVEAR